MFSLSSLLTPYVERINAEMRLLMPPLETHPSFYKQFYYHLGWINEYGEPQNDLGAKRVRSAFCLMACQAWRGSYEQALSAAVAIEYLHEFSLIHDDIQDNSHHRRHRPTLWTLVGVAQAINAGDGLFAMAQQALLHSTTRGVPAETILRAQQRFNESTVHLCLGQHLDMSFEKRATISPEDYLSMIGGKTAALLAFAGEVGAIMGGADEESILAMREIGKAMGLAFQMQDDLLGIWGNPQLTGKSAADDIRTKKKTLPVAYALNHPSSDALRALYVGSGAPFADGQIATAKALIESTGARAYVRGLIQEQSERAQTMLNQLRAPDESLAPLRQLVYFLTMREH